MRRTHTRASGHGLIAALALAILLGAGGLLAHGGLDARFRAQAQARSISALSQAREALLGYAISYGESHDGQDYGYLPCPDAGNTGSTTLGACGARGLSAAGRLPWRTLALPELRDGWGECLWYAVAASVKHNPKATSLNWDSPGQFALQGDDGAALPAASPNGLAIAVILAPGPPLDGQHRNSGSSAPCAGTDSAANDFDAFVEAGTGLASGATLPVRQGSIGSPARNDLIAWLGVDDLYDALRRRSDFATYIDRIGEIAAQHLATRLADTVLLARHAHATPGGLLLTGGLPSAAELGVPAPAAAAHDNWRDQFHIALCSDGSACIGFIDSTRPHSESCRAVLLFGGERIRDGNGRQQRNTPADRADITQYLEGDNPQHFALGIPEFHGAPGFRISDPRRPATQDVVRCLN
ncbi:hypothetical protein [Thauera linaloolentis]|uniref:Uncharacterized protein n=1 Tax=Thauera linaloolentis (strain DSM 12138 / JCM 21573 / CCUG 41526 / CIP 105981 / IAM 15112 / NBRC 102519 / 47Lol) TaxID=1123367 RepID=N6Z457_THAL4|nr:hypothetical protein [Thauera linaloolentis]ENO89218.1 hypothetical protein C666_07145 [Thauera linaloolentis 47Lol = DSM 12138]MCM8564301.1 hypothetical protein [Thauera linaloolentis]